MFIINQLKEALFYISQMLTVYSFEFAIITSFALLFLIMCGSNRAKKWLFWTIVGYVFFNVVEVITQ
jgi:hypothetical protein